MKDKEINNFLVPALSVEAVETLMRSHWPKMFGKGVYVPLQRKIHKALAPLAEPLGITKEQVCEFLAGHCKTIEYRKCVAAGGPRFDPCGNVKGNVSISEQKQAVDALKETA